MIFIYMLPIAFYARLGIAVPVLILWVFSMTKIAHQCLRISFDGELEDTLLGDKAGASLGGLR